MNMRAIRADAEGRSDAYRLLLAAGLLAIFGAGLALRFWRFSSLSITFDEIGTGLGSVVVPDTLTYQSIISFWVPDHMPLFYGMQHLWASLFGVSVTSIRIFPLIISVLTIPFSYLVASRFYGRTAGWVAAVCFLLSPMNIWWAQGSRFYTLMPIMGMLFLYTLVRQLETRSWKWGLAHLAVTFVMLWSSLTTVFLVATELCFLLVCARQRLRWTITWGTALCLVMTPTLIWFSLMLQNEHKGAGKPHPFVPISAIIGNDSMHLNADIPRQMVPLERNSLDTWMNWGLAACFASAIGVLAVSVLRRLLSRRGGNKDDGSRLFAEKGILLLLVIILPPLLAYAAAFRMDRVLLFPHYTLYTLPALYTAVGGCVAWLPRRSLRTGAVLVLVGLYAYQIPLLMPTTRRADWLGAGEYIRAHATAEDVVFATGEFLSGEIFDTNVRWSGKPLGIPVLGAVTTQAAVDAALWYLANGNADKPPEAGRCVWLLLQSCGSAAPCDDLNHALANLGFDYTCFPLVAGDTLFVYRISLNPAAAKPPESGGRTEPVVIPEPNPDIRVDWASFLDHGFPNPGNAPGKDLRGTYEEVLRRAVIHMYHARMDYVMWSLILLASRQRELALAAGDVCLDMSPDFQLGRLVHGLVLEDLGRDDEARAEIGDALKSNPFLRRVFTPFISVFLNGGTREEIRAEVQKIEDMGVYWFTPALWTLYRNRLEPGSPLLPVGIYAPRDEHYQAWVRYFGKNPRRITPLNTRATAQLDIVSTLMHSSGA